MICYPSAYSSSRTCYPPYLAQSLGFWVTCGVKMMSFCQDWCWQPPQTASLIHLRHLQSVWAHWYAVHQHTWQPYIVTHPTWPRFIGVLGHLWSQNDVMLSRLRLTATSTCFPHPSQSFTKCLSTLIWCPLAYGSSLTLSATLLGSEFGVLGHFLWWSQNDVLMSRLKKTATSNCFPHPS